MARFVLTLLLLEVCVARGCGVGLGLMPYREGTPSVISWVISSDSYGYKFHKF